GVVSGDYVRGDAPLLLQVLQRAQFETGTSPASGDHQGRSSRLARGCGLTTEGANQPVLDPGAQARRSHGTRVEGRRAPGYSNGRRATTRPGTRAAHPHAPQLRVLDNPRTSDV